ncbi:hypothetical protein [Chryseobacterium sp. GVT01B]|uniref:hypothetical protein n=1 Tax=Chryseobacterium sp. GVT01B TaxID=2862675 RepID=UPI001CBFDEDF|nr:hypothetical protein [Chryseobacterium sp. GVT01B]
MKKILLIHPHDKSTKFLKRIKNCLVNNSSNLIHYYNVKPNDNSHANCIKLIKSMPEDSLIIFMGHGTKDVLCGSKSDDYEMYEFTSDEAMRENQFYINYYKTEFFNESNFNVFEGKLFFCLACNSRDLSQKVIKDGAKAFIGFGNLPTSKEEFIQEKTNFPSKYLVAQMKSELNYILKKSLLIAIHNSYNFDQLLNLLHFFANQRIAHHLANRKKKKERFILADQLYFLKKNLKLVGDRHILITA